jgi:hypothetical protein
MWLECSGTLEFEISIGGIRYTLMTSKGTVLYGAARNNKEDALEALYEYVRSVLLVMCNDIQ